MSENVEPRRRPRRVLWRILAIVGLPAIGYAGLVGFVHAYVSVREAHYPWTDMTPVLTKLHCRNESDRSVAWGWRLSPGFRWSWIGPSQPAGSSFHSRPPAKSRPSPLLATRARRTFASRDSYRLGTVPTPTAAGAVLVRIEAGVDDDADVYEASFPAVPGEHVRLRVAPDGRAFLAHGDESWIGAARFEDGEEPLRRVGD